MFDRLEPRQHLSITLEDGLLRITGTDAPDVVSISSRTLATQGIPPSFFTIVVIDVNGEVQSFPEPDVRRIRVNTGAGDDSIVIDDFSFDAVSNASSKDLLAARSSEFDRSHFFHVIDAGPGNDTVSGAATRDLIRGGAGDDVLTTSGGAARLHTNEAFGIGDRLIGGPGHDRITGRYGDDTLVGGPGRDTLQGNHGNDRLFGGRGADSLDGGDGADRLFGGAGNDTLLAGRLSIFGAASEPPPPRPDSDRDTLVGGAGLDIAELVHKDRLRLIEATVYP